MPRVVGIDLGTADSVRAALEGGSQRSSPMPGTCTTSSVVAFTEQGERLVGQPAHRQAIQKRFIGRRYEEVTSEPSAVTFDVVEGPDGAVRFDGRGVTELMFRLMRDLEVGS